VVDWGASLPHSSACRRLHIGLSLFSGSAQYSARSMAFSQWTLKKICADKENDNYAVSSAPCSRGRLGAEHQSKSHQHADV
jgi:hypothetical protein